MQTVKVFQSGNSQTVRIPKNYEIDELELFITQVGSSILLTPKKDIWKNFEYSLNNFSEDLFEEGRNEPPIQERDNL